MKINTPFHLIVLLAIFMLSFNATFLHASDSQLSPLQVVDGQLVDSKEKDIQLRGVSLAWHNWWSMFYNEGVISTLKNDWNANILRLPMGIEPDGAYLDNADKSKKIITKAADFAIANNMYVIIDWHAHKLHLEESKAFFAEMARKYKGVPNVIYEIYNEPVDDTWAEIKAYSIEVIKTIRAIEPNAIILVSSPRWAQNLDEVANDPIEGYDNIMYTLHFYAATHKAELREKADYALSKNIPVFVSECAGMEASGDGPIDIDSWNEWHAWMHKHNLSYAMWSISSKAETCSMILPQASTKGDWKEDDLKPWGKIVRKTLKQLGK